MAGHTLRAAARLTARRRLDIACDGLEHVPRSGPVLLAVRHYHHLYDGVVLLDVMPRRVHILVALDWVASRPLRRLMEWATRTARWPAVLRPERLRAAPDGAQPRRIFTAEDVETFRLRSVRDGVDLLCQGQALAVFPEGYPNIDPTFTPKTEPNQFLPFRTGFATLTAIAERRLGEAIPIVPIGLAYQPGRKWRVHVRCGRPIFRRTTHAETAHLAETHVRALS